MQWGDKELWAENEAKMSQAMEVTELDADEDYMSLENADRKAWQGVDNMRKSLRNLHELTTNLVQEEKETIKNTETAAAIYEEQLIETKEKLVNITKQLSRAETQRKGLLRSQTAMGKVPDVDENKAALVNKVHLTVGTFFCRSKPLHSF